MTSLAVELSYWQQTTLRSIGVLLAVLLPAGTIVYLFLFKMMSFMQSRLGPMEAGPYGSMQLLAEVGKWLQKEDLFPERRRPAGLRPGPDRRGDEHVPDLRGHPLRARRLVHRHPDRHLPGARRCRRSR